MRTFLALLLIWSTTALAEVSREEATKQIDEMVRSNMISAEEAAKAKARLQAMSNAEWSALNADAEKKVSEMEGRSPASVDLNEAQYAAIESDLKVLAPHTVVEETQVEQTHVEHTQVEKVEIQHVVVPQTTVQEVKVTETFVPQT